jgi:hypothetical protein
MSEIVARRLSHPDEDIFTLGPTLNTVRTADGTVKNVPDGWTLLPPGDAALTRRVKEAGEHYTVAEKKGRKVFSRGVWALAATIDRIRADLEAERATEGYAKKKEADARRREQAQEAYVDDFHGAVLAFLAFHESHSDLGERLARAVTQHSTPIGSGTVARTQRIPIEQRAEAAAAPQHHGLRFDGDPQDEGQASRGPANAGGSVEGVACPVSARRAGRRWMSVVEGSGRRLVCTSLVLHIVNRSILPFAGQRRSGSAMGLLHRITEHPGKLGDAVLVGCKCVLGIQVNAGSALLQLRLALAVHDQP